MVAAKREAAALSLWDLRPPLLLLLSSRSSVVSPIPLGNARGTAAPILSRDREGAVIKSHARHYTGNTSETGRRAILFWLGMALAAAAALGQSVPSPQDSKESFEGRIIGRVEFDPVDQPLPRAELDRLLPYHAGSPLKLTEVHTAIQALYQTGRFSNVAISARMEGQAVIVSIATELNYFVGRITMDGLADPPNKSQLTTAAKLEAGAEFADNDMEQAIENMQDRMRANGLYRSKITYALDRDPATEEVGIHFNIQTGDRARFDGVNLIGNFNKPEESVIRATHWRRSFGPIVFRFLGWREVTDNRVQTGIANVRKDFQKGDHVQARVSLEKLDYHEQTNRVTPTLSIDGGPILEVRTSGVKVSAGRLRQLIPIFQERTVDHGLLIEGQRNLVEYFQSQGYFDAKVEFEEDTPEAGRQVIDYRIDRRLRYKLSNVEIAGNRYFDAATLRERLDMTPASFLRYRYGRYSQKLLDRDKESIRDLYRSNGFREAEVESKVDSDFKGQRGHISVLLEVKEGPQSFVSKLELEGMPDADKEYLRSLLQSTEGEPFSEANIAADRDSILSYYYNNGYPDATLDWTQTPGPGANRLNLRYTIHTGKRVYVRSVLVRGLENTDPALVNNRISLAAGDPISQSRIAASQQKLYDLGIFAKVQTAIQNPDGEEESKYVLFQMDEARKYSFTAGIGAELGRIGGGVTTFDDPAGTTGFSPRISLGISRLNVLGLGHTVSLNTLASTIEQRALISYLAPQFTGNAKLALTFSALFDDANDIRTFHQRREEGAVQLAQRISRANVVQYRYSFRLVNVNNLKISPELVPLLSQPVRVGQVSVSFLQDRRDDPVNSHRGFYNTVDVGLALRQFGSETDFTRLLLRNSTYHPIGRDIVIARSLQFGWINRLGGLAQIPLAERYFSGGASTQRAFPDNQAGPRDLETGFPLGGNALLFHSTELRFPLIGDNVGGVFFHDMGNVYDRVQDISFRFRQHNLQDFNYTVQAVGFGIRYRTPVGPLRVDFSLSPNSPRFFGFKGTYDQLLLMQGVQVNQRINVFQFHFSLGQTY